MVMYHPVLSFLTRATICHHITLWRLEYLSQVFPSPPMISFRRPKNLRDLLVHATLTTTTTTNRVFGSFQCCGSRQKTYPILRTTNTFTSNVTNEHFIIKVYASCKTMNVNYLIECKRCGLQYVGKTGQLLYLTMNGHWFEVVHHKIEESTAATHFNSADHSEANLSSLVIDGLWRKDAILRKNCENR